MAPSDRSGMPAALTRRLGSAPEPTISAEQHRRWVRLIAHLEGALSLLDELDEGDGQSAAFAQRAVNAAKKELRQRLREQRPARGSLRRKDRRWPWSSVGH